MRPRLAFPRRALAGLALAVVAVAVAAGCEVSGSVLVDVDEDGSGVVTVEVRLDAEALSRLGDPDTEIRTDDLEAAGWERHPEVTRDGDTVIAVSKGFGAPGQLQSVLAEVGGQMFEDFAVDVEDGFATTTWTVTGRVRVAGDLAALGDEGLAAALDGLPIGWTQDELEEQFGGAPTVPLDVQVALPPEGGAVDSRAQVDLAGGGEQQLEVSVSAVDNDGLPVVLLVAAGVLLVAAFVWRLSVAGRRRSNT